MYPILSFLSFELGNLPPSFILEKSGSIDTQLQVLFSHLDSVSMGDFLPHLYQEIYVFSNPESHEISIKKSRKQTKYSNSPTRIKALLATQKLSREKLVWKPRREVDISRKQDRAAGDQYYLRRMPCYNRFVFMALSKYC